MTTFKEFPTIVIPAKAGIQWEKRSQPTIKFPYLENVVTPAEAGVHETDEGWSPYLSLEDAYKLDDVREALRRGDLQGAARMARIFKLQPVSLPRRAPNKAAPDSPH